MLKSKAKHAAISAPLDRPFHFTNKPFIVQYDVTFQSGQECGGAYLKLLTQETGMRLSQFRDKTPYSIMFGPDKCGNDFKVSVHFSLLSWKICSLFLFIYFTLNLYSCTLFFATKIPRMVPFLKNMLRNQQQNWMTTSRMENHTYTPLWSTLTTRLISRWITKL